MPDPKPKPDLEKFSPSPIFGFVWRCSFSFSGVPTMFRLFHPHLPVSSCPNVDSFQHLLISLSCCSSPRLAMPGRLIDMMRLVRQSRSVFSSVEFRRLVSRIPLSGTSSGTSSRLFCHLTLSVSSLSPFPVVCSLCHSCRLAIPVLLPSIPGVHHLVRQSRSLISYVVCFPVSRLFPCVTRSPYSVVCPRTLSCLTLILIHCLVLCLVRCPVHLSPHPAISHSRRSDI